MSSRETLFNVLILLSIVSFGVIGSLSHVFNITILTLLTLNLYFYEEKTHINTVSKRLFLVLCSIFFIFTVRSFFSSDPLISLKSLSPMLPLPLIGLMILLATCDIFRISAARLALYAQISVIFAFLVYLLLSNGLGDQYGLRKYFTGRLELFSGNPIPFSASIFGVTIFCFSNWRDSNNLQKLTSIICLCLGIQMAGLLSETRGTLLSFVLSAPIFFWFIFRSVLSSIVICIFIIFIFWLLQTHSPELINLSYLTKISKGMETLFLGNMADTSMRLRLDVWTAALQTIQELPFFGYDVSNRFTAIEHNLPTNFSRNYTHPHNDIFASVISAGFIAAPLSLISLLSPMLAAIYSKNDSGDTKLFIGAMVTIGIIATANVNTVFFNDITSAWLAFAVFLIWNMKSIN